MGKQGKKREQYLRIVNDKLLYLTSKAGADMGDRVDVYERDGVIAIVRSEWGTYHVGSKSDSCKGKNIASEELVKFLLKKYSLSCGARLPIWQDPLESGEILYTGMNVTKAEAAYRLDGNFSKVELGYRKRYGARVFIEDSRISFTANIRTSLPRRLALYGEGETLALLGTPDGPFIMEYRNDYKGDAIYCRQLAEYCKARFNCKGRSILLYAAIVDGGISFAQTEEALPEPSAPYTPDLIDLGEPRNRFISLLKRGMCYFSTQGIRLLGLNVNLYEADGFLAFKSEYSGTLSLKCLQNQHILCSNPLWSEVVKRYPGANKLYLRPCGDLLVLVPDCERIELPSPEHFRYVHLSTAASRKTRCETPTSHARGSNWMQQSTAEELQCGK